MGGTAMREIRISLDDQSLEVLENLAAAQRCTVEELVLSLARRAIRAEQKVKKPKGNPLFEDAPLDAFLPEGADPFEPVTALSHQLASSFADVQARMRFAGTPSLFRDAE